MHEEPCSKEAEKFWYIPKCKIKNTTGHTSANGLDDYESGDEREQQIISRAIDSSGPVPEAL